MDPSPCAAYYSAQRANNAKKCKALRSYDSDAGLCLINDTLKFNHTDGVQEDNHQQRRRNISDDEEIELQ